MMANTLKAGYDSGGVLGAADAAARDMMMADLVEVGVSAGCDWATRYITNGYTDFYEAGRDLNYRRIPGLADPFNDNGGPLQPPK